MDIILHVCLHIWICKYMLTRMNPKQATNNPPKAITIRQLKNSYSLTKTILIKVFWLKKCNKIS